MARENRTVSSSSSVHSVSWRSREGEIPLRASNIYEDYFPRWPSEGRAEEKIAIRIRVRPSRRCRRGFRPVATNSRIKRVDDRRRGEQAGK